MRASKMLIATLKEKPNEAVIYGSKAILKGEVFAEDNLTVIEFSKTNSPVVIRCNKCGHTYSYKRGTTLYESKRKYFCKLCNTESVKCM